MSRWRYPFSFGITRSGGIYILIVFLMALEAVRTGNNLIYLILALLLAATFASGAIARVSLRSVFVSLQVPQNVFERERVSIKISLKNRKRWCSAFSILVEDLALVQARSFATLLRKRVFGRSGVGAAVPVLQHAAYFPAIPPGEARAELVSQEFAHRGAYRLEGLRLSTQFPFGFFRRGERVSVSGEVLVYPSIRPISSDFHLLPFLPGKLEGRRSGQGESLYAIREYREGESARSIHWKATAKTGRLMALEYAQDEESEFCLILDTLVRGPDAVGRFEKAVALAASLAAHFVRETAEFEYLTPGEHIARGTGTEHLYRILRSLAVVQCRTAPGAGDPLSGAGDPDINEEFSGGSDKESLGRILSEKVFKIMITSRPKGTLPPSIWRSSHVIYFDEL